MHARRTRREENRPVLAVASSKKAILDAQNFRSTDIDIAGGQQELGSEWDIDYRDHLWRAKVEAPARQAVCRHGDGVGVPHVH